ncbi:MAG: hypothetical protein HOV94_07195 [Saccharothrix sp.]|nr:hypothetical protein [Saccharothrix sp.]
MPPTSSDRARQGERFLVAASLRGDRAIHRDGLGEAGRPRCPWCCTPLRPGRVLSGWAPGPRRRTHACLECDGGWCVADDPGVLVDALAAYWLAHHDPAGPVERRAAVTRRLRELHLEVPHDTRATVDGEPRRVL